MDQSNKSESTDPQYTLKLAFLTMKERCKQLQARLGIVEDENALLRQQCEKNISTTGLNLSQGDESLLSSPTKQLEELKKQNTQLAHHIYMVSLENRQLWKRLTRLYQNNQSSHQPIKTTGSTKQHPSLDSPPTLSFSVREIPGFKDKFDKFCSLENKENDLSLEEIILIDEKTDLEQQDIDVDESQIVNEINSKNIGYTYPENLLIGTDSLEQLKDHDMRLIQFKKTLVLQQQKLRNTLNNLKKMKINQTCNNCKNSITKLMCQAGTQFDSDSSLKENGETQTSLPSSSLNLDKKNQSSEEDNVCPLCGVVYKNSVSFNLFHEHVINHFTQDISDDFEIIT